MSAIRRLVLRILNLLHHGDRDGDLSREIDAHLDQLQYQFERRGLSRAEARLAARRTFGGVEQVKEVQRDARSFAWLEDLRRDLGYGVRTLARTPSFTAVAMLTLALGIGAVTVIYSVLRNVVLDPFPYTRSDRMVNLVLQDASGRNLRDSPRYASEEFLDYQDQATVFEDVVGTSVEGMQWVHDTGAERLQVGWMTPNGFAFLGVPPQLGRVFADADAAPGAPPVAVMNHRAWVRLFNADPNVIGRTLVLNEQPYTVIGIMPPRFEWNIADLWIPSALSRSDDPTSVRGRRAFQAHLRPGVSIAEAEAQLNVIAARRAAEHPGDYPAHSRMVLITVINWVVRDFRGVLYTLFGAVSLLLVIACCNVANMLLARATTREREMCVRAAIGATRGRIVRQLLVESALLAGGGLAAGCLLAYVGIEALSGFMPRGGVPWETQIRLDRPVLVFALVAATVATLGFGLFPALQSARRDLVAGVGSGERGSANRRQTRMRGSLVVAQVALSIVLLLGAGLLMRTFVKLANVEWGFDTRNLLIAGIAFPPRQNRSPDDVNRFYREARDRIAALPGVRSVAIANGPAPFAGFGGRLEILGTATGPEDIVGMTFCSEQEFDTVGLTLMKGRLLTAIDIDKSHHVAVINEALAKKYFRSTEPLGAAIRLPNLAGGSAPVADPTFEIVGVLRDFANAGPTDPPAPQAWLPFSLRGPSGVGLVVRTSADPSQVIRSIREAILAVDRQVALVQPTSMDEWMQRVFFARPRFSLLVLGIFACTGMVLVAFGVYGVLAYTISQQTREIAIRMALGGERGHVVRMVLRLGLQLVGVGLLIGVAVSLATNRLLESQLWTISPHDPLTFAAVIAAIVCVGMVACLVPARRAVRIEPMVALRHE
jgi:putative ABC transport system permease protein